MLLVTCYLLLATCASCFPGYMKHEAYFYYYYYYYYYYYIIIHVLHRQCTAYCYISSLSLSLYSTHYYYYYFT